MSIRSLIEINHDMAGRDEPEFLAALSRYVRSGSRETAADLERFGFKVLGRRHHSGNFYLDDLPDGFPVKILDRQSAQSKPDRAPKSADDQPILGGEGDD